MNLLGANEKVRNSEINTTELQPAIAYCHFSKQGIGIHTIAANEEIITWR